MDFFIPDFRLSIFCDGLFWHASPDIFKAEDIVYSGKTAKEIWKRDNQQNIYLGSKGFMVLRLWQCTSRRKNELTQYRCKLK
jgi:G:T-mismatch repair DNA endonuclease (very short patch repair protein)